MKKIIFSLVFICFFTVNAFAYSTEIAEASAHYEHPISKLVEDPGNNVGIGQGMCENVVDAQALFEEVDERLYLTLRFNLADNIENVSFSVQKPDDKDFVSVDNEIVAQTDTTRDYRIIVPSRDVIVRTEAFITAMGRAVVFYIDFDDFVEGNTDFITLGENGQSALEKSYENGDRLEMSEVDKAMSSSGLGYEHGLLMKGDKELADFEGFASGHGALKEKDEDIRDKSIAQTGENKTAKTKLGAFSSAVLNGIVFFFVLLTFFFLATALVLYLLTKQEKELNEAREEALYEDE